MRIPEGCFRRRLCIDCKADLEADGYLTHPERDTMRRGDCERCGRMKSVTAVYRYTLSWRERKRRGLP